MPLLLIKAEHGLPDHHFLWGNCIGSYLKACPSARTCYIASLWELPTAQQTRVLNPHPSFLHRNSLRGSTGQETCTDSSPLRQAAGESPCQSYPPLSATWVLYPGRGSSAGWGTSHRGCDTSSGVPGQCRPRHWQQQLRYWAQRKSGNGLKYHALRCRVSPQVLRPASARVPYPEALRPALPEVPRPETRCRASPEVPRPEAQG